MKYNLDEVTEICKNFEYSEQSPTGLIWKIKRPYTKHQIGDCAGHVETSGYSRVSINNKRYQTTHCILILHGISLKENEEVDHLDGDPTNNRIKNLRVVEHRVNMQNKKKSSRNGSGLTGIAILKSSNRVVAYYTVEGKQKLKYFGIRKFGLEVAIELAKQWRLSMIDKANRDKENYTQRHIFN